MEAGRLLLQSVWQYLFMDLSGVIQQEMGRKSGISTFLSNSDVLKRSKTAEVKSCPTIDKASLQNRVRKPWGPGNLSPFIKHSTSSTSQINDRLSQKISLLLKQPEIRKIRQIIQLATRGATSSQRLQLTNISGPYNFFVDPNEL